MSDEVKNPISILDLAEEQFSSIQRKQIDVPEWNTTIYAKPLTLAEIGRQINVSRERVRQLEAKAILKLRVMTNHQQAA